MNHEHPNISILEKFNPADIASAAEIVADDAIFHYYNPELPDMEGDYIGFEGFQAFFNKISELTQGTFQVHPQSISTWGDEFVVTYTKNTMVLPDKEIETDVVVVWRILDGKIREVWDIPGVHTAKVKTLNT
ncbi:nuclear transport factor 2 family protein [Flagellimonas allohymeniacidonis]|uniref:Nuclear transport factor 2 family protein n=1 Tax=Flagellimonas allohymeniacidonis TaxID=2517819 RepID=A0A4Q8QEA4_9FLAO|nr:nuclear transport factor 2 family protein [Allomuricauda hymeniacidonis]TAI48832.1 nuclear transport factor 2 family protein [Allomuricauda hymeniacidonis]